MSSEQEFTQVLIEAGIATTEETIQKQWGEILKAQGFEIQNNSPFSPFWRLQKAIIGQPALKLTEILTQHIMPNTFVMLAKDQWLDLHGESRNTPRLPATKTQGNVTITRTDSTDIFTIPSGTIVESLPLNGIVYQIKTLFDTQFSEGEAQKSALTEALLDGGDHNLSAGYYHKFSVPIENVTVTNDESWLVRAGQAIERDKNYQLRIRDKFATLGNYHVDAVYRSIISEFPGILADNIIFEHNAPRGPGTANAYVFLDIGTVSPAVIDEINNHIASGYHGHGDDLLVKAIPTQAENITLDYWLNDNESDIDSEINQFIRAAFRENNAYQTTKCRPTGTFSFSNLGAELHNQFSEIKSLQFTNTDLVVDFWMPKIGTLIMTKQA